MYCRANEKGAQKLLCDSYGPNLEVTDTFWTVVKTLPADSPVPSSIVKLGLLSRQLVPEPSDIAVDFRSAELTAGDRAVIPPQTLKAVLWLLIRIRDELENEEKQQIGSYCERVDLNRAFSEGDSANAVKKAAEKQTIQWPKLFTITEERDGEETSGDDNSESDAKAHRRTSPKDSPFESGKRVTTRGGERITGKNPFADTDQLKDTGLHQGGG